MPGVNLLLDENLSYRLKRLLPPLYDEVEHVGSVLGDKTPDDVIVQHAMRTGAIVVTADADPVEIADRFGPPSKVVRVGLHRPSSREVTDCLHRNFDAILAFAADPLATSLTIE